MPNVRDGWRRAAQGARAPMGSKGKALGGDPGAKPLEAGGFLPGLFDILSAKSLPVFFLFSHDFRPLNCISVPGPGAKLVLW